jgi:hypothetical protein
VVVAGDAKTSDKLKEYWIFDCGVGNMEVIPISETLEIKDVGLDEAWLQQQVWENPSHLGLGDLEGVTKEKAVSSGGKLDILLKDPTDDSMYEVEVMLGETDPSHIIRTIEYWDLVKKRWPQRQHYAVLIAEKITKRFFNVIQILSGSVPIVAIQANIIKGPGGLSLHFTKILDVYEEQEDETEVDGGVYDEKYWSERSFQTLSIAKKAFQLIHNEYPETSLGFNKYSITITKGGYNLVSFHKRGGESILLAMRHGGKEQDFMDYLDSAEIIYTMKPKAVKVVALCKKLEDEPNIVLDLVRINYEWWMS